MGVFQESLGGYAEGQKSERCKRDYEKDIAILKKSSDVTVALASAIDEYIDVNGKGEKAFTLTSLYGALMLQQRDIGRAIDRLQEEWESEKE